MYGTQDAANIWQSDYEDHFGSAGFVFGVANPALFRSVPQLEDIQGEVPNSGFGGSRPATLTQEADGDGTEVQESRSHSTATRMSPDSLIKSASAVAGAEKIVVQEFGDACGLGHGDDFLFLGDDLAIEAMDALLKSKYEVVRTGVLGTEAGDDKSLKILNREIRYVEDSSTSGVARLELEGDPRHAQMLVEEFGLAQL